LSAKTGEGLKMEKVPWDMGRDGVVVQVRWDAMIG